MLVVLGERNSFEAAARAPPLVKVQPVHRARGAAALGRELPDDEQPLGLGIGEGLEQNAVDDREDRGVRADAERKQGEDADGEPDIAPQRAKRLSRVPYEVIEQRDAPCVATLVLASLDTAERAHGRPARLVGRHAGSDVFLDLTLDVVTQLVVELLLDLGPSEERAEAHPDDVWPLLDTHRD